MALTFKLRKDFPEEGTTVIKIVAGDKYYITKTKNIDWLVGARGVIRTAYVHYSYRGGIKSDNIYLPLVKHMYDNKITNLFVDVLYNNTDGYKVLQMEALLLSEDFGKKNCLNPNKEPYIPKLKTSNPATDSKWLTLDQVGNYNRHVKPKLEKINEVKNIQKENLAKEKELLTSVVNNKATKSATKKIMDQYTTKVAIKKRIAEINKQL